MQLEPTEDIVFFPQLFVLEPGQERVVRIGSETEAGQTERSYRLILQELPPLESSNSERPQIGILTGVSVPLFLQPALPERQGELGIREAYDGNVYLEVLNTGNVHLQLTSVYVWAKDAAEEIIFEQEVRGGYVLAGETRLFEAALPESDCPRVRTLQVEAFHQNGSFATSFNLPTDACSP
jgi:fimbrial chaperone protein